MLTCMLEAEHKANHNQAVRSWKTSTPWHLILLLNLLLFWHGSHCLPISGAAILNC